MLGPSPWPGRGSRGRRLPLLDKYAEHGAGQFILPEVLEAPLISDHGNVIEIAKKFGGSDQLGDALHQLQALLYAA